MADIKQSYLGLKYSTDFNIQGMQEADIDLNLSPVVSTSATIYGQVTDGTKPVANVERHTEICTNGKLKW